MLPPPAQIPPARIPQWHLWTIGRQQSRSSISAGTRLRRPPRGAPPAGGSVRAGVEAAGSWAGRAGRRRSGEFLWRRRCQGTDPHGLPGCRDGMDSVHRRREMDDGWRPPAESMLPPLQTGLDLISAQACARRCVQRAGRLAGWLWVEMGRRDPSRRSPSARGMHINHVGRSGWAGAVRRGGCNLERLRRARPLAQWVGAGGCTAGGVPHRPEHPPHSQRPHNMHVYQARTENPCSMGLEGCYTRAGRGTDIWYLRGRDGALLQAAARGSCT